jgi:hypothetical protein
MIFDFLKEIKSYPQYFLGLLSNFQEVLSFPRYDVARQLRERRERRPSK